MFLTPNDETTDDPETIVELDTIAEMEMTTTTEPRLKRVFTPTLRHYFLSKTVSLIPSSHVKLQLKSEVYIHLSQIHLNSGFHNS